MGLRNWLPGGTSALSPREAQDEIQAAGRVVIDVRERHEFQAGHIAGARHVALGSLDPSALAPETRYVVVCHSGTRSAIATRRLQAAGRDAVNLRGGMRAWSREGLPIRRDGTPRNR
jgi:rhodanese-related sulfurtransferase